MTQTLAPKQIEFIANSTAKWNLAHGSVRSGKTVGTLVRFMQAAAQCPDSQIFMVGHSSETIYQNAIRLLLESEELSFFRPFCNWAPGKRQLLFRDKQIHTLGAKDEGAIGGFQGKTFSLVYCDEITLYPESIINMIDTRLSKPHSMGFASMNPVHPTHIVKQWVDKAEAGDPNYYSLHYTLDDNPFVDEHYKQRIRDSLSGLFYKRNYLGMWCLAEGAIFDFFDRDIHVVDDPPRAAEYWIAGVDYGTVNPFACVLIGVSTGRYDQTGPMMWVEKEYYYDPKKKGRQKTNSEFAQDVQEFLEPYAVRAIYIDPSAEAFQLELKRRNLHVVHANNAVQDGIQHMTSLMKKGSLFVCKECENVIREIETYVWDSKQAAQGKDAPLKKDDHCFSAETKVICIDGQKPIKDILPNDLVLTSKGFKKVERCGISHKLVKEFSLYGTKITCTPDHRFYTDRGWVEIQHLIRSDILYTIGELWGSTENVKSLSIKGNDIEGIQNLKSNLNDIITAETEDITIDISGRIISDRYPKDAIFITSIKTLLTMIYPIFNVSHHKNMQNFMRVIGYHINHAKKPWKQPNCGTEVRKVLSGIENTQKNTSLESGNRPNTSANNATKSTKPVNDQTADFVRINVSLNGEETVELIMSLEFVKNVEQFLSITDLPRNWGALPNVVEGSEKEIPVYNLDVEDAHEFFAEGFLVHNSIDSLRYACFTHQIAVYDPYRQEQFAREYRENRFSCAPRTFH